MSMTEMMNASLDDFISAQPEYLKSPLHRGSSAKLGSQEMRSEVSPLHPR